MHIILYFLLQICFHDLSRIVYINTLHSFYWLSIFLFYEVTSIPLIVILVIRIFNQCKIHNFTLYFCKYSIISKEYIPRNKNLGQV